MFKENYSEFPALSGIYKITTIHNGISYIGSALSLRKRMKDHRNHLKKNTHHVKRLQRVFNSYGENDFKVEFLKIYPKLLKLNSTEHKELVKDEEYFISALKPEYNTILTPTTQKNNPATCKKVYQYDKEGNFIQEWTSCREVLRELGIQVQNGLKGKNRSSKSFLWSYEKMDKLPKYENQSGVRRSVIMQDLQGNDLMKFDSIGKCSEYLEKGVSMRNKVQRALKENLVVNGYKFVYCKS